MTPRAPAGLLTRPTRTRDPFEEWLPRPSGLIVAPQHAPQRRPVAIDLFAGAGGFSVGFHRAGWHVAAAVEYDLDAAATYLLNLGSARTMLHTGPGMSTGPKGKQTTERWHHERCADVLTAAGTGWIAAKHSEHDDRPAPDEPPVEHFYRADVRDLTGQMILDDLGMKPGDVGAVIGGPPCQGFSIAGKQDVMDPRNSLVFEFTRLVCEIQPHSFVMENVPNIDRMRTPEGMPVLDAVAASLTAGGYGEYDALRRALSTSPGARAGVRTARTVQRTRPDEPDDDSELLDLWGEP